MIPGDIDLTENLDFRKVVKKEIPQLPALWNKKQEEVNKSRLRYVVDDDALVWNTYFSDTTITTISTNSTISIYDSEFNYYYKLDAPSTSNVLYQWNSTSNTIHGITDSGDLYTLTLPDVERIDKDVYDVFGNKIKHPKPIPDIPWDYLFSRDEYIPRIPWTWNINTNKNRGFISYSGDKKIPWVVDSKVDTLWWSPYRSNHYHSRIEKAIYLICWLSEKPSSFIERYFDSENVDLSYLTNMSWIRVKDAIVD